MYFQVVEVLRQKIVEAVEKQYLAAIYKKYIGYGGSTSKEMIEHLKKQVNVSTKDQGEMT